MGEVFGIPVLKLLEIFAVPITVGVAVPWLNWLQKKRELAIENQRAQNKALEAYLDQMSQLLADKEPQPGDSVSAVIRARTLSLLEGLHASLEDRFMIGTIVLFLYESGLITTEGGPIVNLARANLEKVILMDIDLPSPPTQIDLSKAREDMRKRGPTATLCDQPIPEPELNLSGVNLKRTRLSEATLISVDLSHADLSEAALLGARLAGSRLVNADLSDAFLPGADLKFADLKKATLFDAVLSGINSSLPSADLTWARLHEAKLSGADLREANLTSACLPRATLSHLAEDYQELHRVGNTKLSGANLNTAYLENADLRQVDMTGTDLTDADLTDVDLSGANLTKAKVTEEQLAKCKSLKGATMPDGQKYEDWLKSKGRKGVGDNSRPS